MFKKQIKVLGFNYSKKEKNILTSHTMPLCLLVTALLSYAGFEQVACTLNIFILPSYNPTRTMYGNLLWISTHIAAEAVKHICSG